jgi:hypothetical protein
MHEDLSALSRTAGPLPSDVIDFSRSNISSNPAAPQHVGQGADRWLKRLWVHVGQGMLSGLAEKAPAIVIFHDGRCRFCADNGGKPKKKQLRAQRASGTLLGLADDKVIRRRRSHRIV